MPRLLKILLIILVWLAAVVVIALYVVLPYFLKQQTAGIVARVDADLRTYERALEAYRKERGTYPATDDGAVLTTPVAYLPGLIDDVFSTATRGAERPKYGFATSGAAYVVWSVGPDGVSQIIGAEDLASDGDGVRAKSYDATNGSASAGDLVRTNVF